MNTEKIMKQLRENNMTDNPFMLYCTKWNASIGTKIITVCGRDMFITPYMGFYGVNVKKAEKINKSQIESITLPKGIYSSVSLCITLKDGKKLKYRFINSSWIKAGEDLVSWFKA